jgi:hypothetical protein
MAPEPIVDPARAPPPECEPPPPRASAAPATSEMAAAVTTAEWNLRIFIAFSFS